MNSGSPRSRFDTTCLGCGSSGLPCDCCPRCGAWPGSECRPLCELAHPELAPSGVPTPTEVLDALDGLIRVAQKFYEQRHDPIPPIAWAILATATESAEGIRARMRAADAERFADGTPVPDEDGSAPDADVSAA